jgi:hypothetical protein
MWTINIMKSSVHLKQGIVRRTLVSATTRPGAGWQLETVIDDPKPSAAACAGRAPHRCGGSTDNKVVTTLAANEPTGSACDQFRGVA